VGPLLVVGIEFGNIKHDKCGGTDFKYKSLNDRVEIL
jgi:hypothetical protein